MRRRDLPLSLMAGTAGALLAPRRALVDGFGWYRDELPGQSRGRVIAMRFRDVALNGIPLSMVGPGDVFAAAESGPSAPARGPDVGAV